MAVEQIKETDTLNQGRVKINAILDQSNASSEKVNDYQDQLKEGIAEAKKIADEAGKEAVEIATEAGNKANETANQALSNSKTAITTADQAVSTANNNKQEFDTLRNDFDQLVAESGDSNPEIVQARTDTQGIKQATLANRLQIDFANRMTKAEGISLLVGDSNIKIMMDFVGKTAGNTATNPNKYFSDFTAKTLKKPTDTWNEVSQADYNKLASRDDSGVSTGSTQSGVIPQQRGEFNIIEIVKALIPQIFEGMDKEQSVTFIKNNFISFTINERLKGTSPNNKNIKVSTYLQSSDSWSTQIQEAAAEFKDFAVQINDKNFITNEGFVHLINYTDPSNGVTSSNIETDYSGIQIELSVNAQDILEKSGFAKSADINKKIDDHVDDKNNPHGVTKKQVGLENVGNYSFANDGEAVAGTSSTKYMHPKNVSDAIKGQAVTQTGDQFIAGVKDFTGGLQASGLPVTAGYVSKAITDADRADLNNITEVNGLITRIGNLVFVAFNFKCSNWASGVETRWIIKVPTGYRRDSGLPAQIPLVLTRNANQSADARAVIDQSNIIQAKSGNGSSYISGMWVTNDEWPN
ncbi:hypothetical protein A5819_003105 [Enterococcus sp. 7E2_DIV0204]|uniref:hypothetical protein n=1 Tax=unclassified Enterococcus TaxID=2608891 RepID=UPI000A33C2B6|nr:MULTISPECIES: hypothetical protein [unclassified Enterococcus]OTN83678.1 hypothetical protein A5819_003775 [Enterococcus sp. 7E2_DIV0204]OTN90605.1 hypothetical protein A5819_003105 [Enterococcus sp. 7E2_DIV0204]OTP53061.1 hypothetical protein A5884_002264 [Enterococcus sp. 7D2_DIV0200]